jgi:uncharacterized membrane protein
VAYSEKTWGREPVCVWLKRSDCSKAAFGAGGYSSTLDLLAPKGEINLAVRLFPNTGNDSALKSWREELTTIRGLNLTEIFDAGTRFANRRDHSGCKRLLQLSRWSFGAIEGPEKQFPEIGVVMKHAKKHGFGCAPHIYYANAVYDQRFAFHAQEFLKYYLRNDKEVKVDVVYDINFPGGFKDLFNYDVVAITDFPVEALVPYVDVLKKYVEGGGNLVFFGGYAGFGGRFDGYGSYRALAELIPVKISDKPDWVDQDVYLGEFNDKGNKWLCANWFKSTVTGKQVRRFGPVIPLEEVPGWMSLGNRVKVDAPIHPAVAGIPFNEISPSYHKVSAKPGAKTLLSVNNDPLLVFQQLGKGKIVAATISDFRKLWAWKQTSTWFERMILWLTNKSPKLISSFENYKGCIVLSVRNTTNAPVSVSGELTIRSEEFESVYHEKVKCAKVLPKGVWKVVASFKVTGGNLKPGRYEAEYKPDHNGYPALFTFTIKRALPLKIKLSFKHRRHFSPGQSVKPSMELPNQIPKDAVLRAYIRDQRGVIVKNISFSGKTPESVSSYAFALGRYAYVAEVKSGDGLLGYAVERFFMARKPKVEVPVMVYGNFMCPKLTLASYTGLALSKRLSRIFNVKFYAGEAPLLDESLPFGINYFIHAAYLGPLNANSPKAMEKMRTRLAKKCAPFRDFPSVYGCYLDDEGWARAGMFRNWGRTDPDQAADYKKMFGEVMPAHPKNIEQNVRLADFYIDSYTRKVKAAAEVCRSVNPAWKQALIQSNVRPASIGGWPMRNFDFTDSLFMDIYPPTVEGIGESLLYANWLRTIEYHTGKPSWMCLGEYRETADACRMQVWVALMNAMKGYGWYSIRMIKRTDYPELERITSLIKNNELLVKSLAAPPAKTAVCFLKSESAWWSPEGKSAVVRHLTDYQHKLWRLCAELARADIMPDVITEEDMDAGRLDDYDLVVLGGGVKELTRKTVAALAEFAENRTLMITSDCAVKIPGAKPWNLEKAAKIAEIPFSTPNPDVVSRLLYVDGLKNLILYNHSNKPVAADVAFDDESAKIACEVGSEREIDIKTVDGRQRLSVALKPYDGSWLVLLPSAITGLEIMAIPFTPGDAWTIGAALKSAKQIPGNLPLKVEVTRPDGLIIKDTILTRNGYGTATLPTAPNEPTGEWSIKLTEPASGTATEKTILVK